MATRGKKKQWEGILTYDLDIREILEELLLKEILEERARGITDVEVSPGPSPDSLSVRLNVPRPLDNINCSFIVDDINEEEQ